MKPKPYVSCIKINGCPILPPQLDDAQREEMREYRELAVAMERRLSLTRQQKMVSYGCNNSVDSGIAGSSALSHTFHSENAQSFNVDLFQGSFQQSEIVDDEYLSALSSQENSFCSLYKTPQNKQSMTPVGSPSNDNLPTKTSIEQRLSFSIPKSYSHDRKDLIGRPNIRDLQLKRLRLKRLSLSLECKPDPECHEISVGLTIGMENESKNTPTNINQKCTSTHDNGLIDESISFPFESQNIHGARVTSANGLEHSPNSTTLTASTDLNPYLDNTAISSIESPTRETRQQDIDCPGIISPSCPSQGTSKDPSPLDNFEQDDGEQEQALTPRFQLEKSPPVPSQLNSTNSSCWKVPKQIMPINIAGEVLNLRRPDAIRQSASSQIDSRIVSQETGEQSDYASSHLGSVLRPVPLSYNLVPPNISLRPTVTVADWLLSSRVSSSFQNNPESSLEKSLRTSAKSPAQFSPNREKIELLSKTPNNLDLDLEPCKLVSEDKLLLHTSECVPDFMRNGPSNMPSLESSVAQQATIVSNIIALPSSRTTAPLDIDQSNPLETADETVQTVIVSDESFIKFDFSSEMLASNIEEVIPPLIRQHSFTVQTGPSECVRQYAEEKGIELNTGTFQNPKHTEPVTEYASTSQETSPHSFQEKSGRKGWDLASAKAMWQSADQLHPFAKPITPALRSKKLSNAKSRTRSVPSIHQLDSLSSSASSSPGKSRVAFGSVDGLNYTPRSPYKRPRRSLNFNDSLPKSGAKLSGRLRTSRLPGLPPGQRTESSISSGNKQVPLKCRERNPFPSKSEKTGGIEVINNNRSANNSVKVPESCKEKSKLFCKSSATQLPTKTIQCPQENIEDLLSLLRTEHDRQMAELLEKQRVEQKKIREAFMIQQRKLIEEIQRSYPTTFNTTEVTQLTADSSQPVVETKISHPLPNTASSYSGELSWEENLSSQLETHSPMADINSVPYKSNFNRCQETVNFLKENVDNRNDSLKKVKRRNNSSSKENCASYVSKESLCEYESNKENVQQFELQNQLNFEDLNTQIAAFDCSLPHLIISDNDLDILPHSNDFETSVIGDQSAKSLETSTRISKVIMRLSEIICNEDLEKSIPNVYQTFSTVSTLPDATSKRNLQNSIISTTGLDNRVTQPSYETLDVHSPCDYESLAIRIPSRNGSETYENTSHSSQGKVRHSPRKIEMSHETRPIPCQKREDQPNGVQVACKTFIPKTCSTSRQDFPHHSIQGQLEQEKLAASKIIAAARGFLVRRLMKTEHVQNMIMTIAETLMTALDLREEINSETHHPSPADLSLRKRLEIQIESEYQSFYALFFSSSVEHRMGLIAADRERLRRRTSRPTSGRRPLSFATQRSLKRKQELRNHDHSPVARPPSSHCSFRRPLWETTSTCTQRVCSAHQSVAPYWVVNPKPRPAKPPPRKPWR